MVVEDDFSEVVDEKDADVSEFDGEGVRERCWVCFVDFNVVA